MIEGDKIHEGHIVSVLNVRADRDLTGAPLLPTTSGGTPCANGRLRRRSATTSKRGNPAR